MCCLFIISSEFDISTVLHKFALQFTTPALAECKKIHICVALYEVRNQLTAPWTDADRYCERLLNQFDTQKTKKAYTAQNNGWESKSENNTALLLTA